MASSDNSMATTTAFTLYRSDVNTLDQLAHLMETNRSAALRDSLPSEGLMQVYRKRRERNPKLSFGAFVEQAVQEWDEAVSHRRSLKDLIDECFQAGVKWGRYHQPHTDEVPA